MRLACVALILAAAIGLSAATTETAKPESPPVLRKSPEFVIKFNDGHQMLLSSLKGKVVALLMVHTTCPHCQAVGTLNRHGCLHGFDDSRRKTVRARRIFCSNRHARPGCGHTFTVWCADKIRRLTLRFCAATRAWSGRWRSVRTTAGLSPEARTRRRVSGT